MSVNDVSSCVLDFWIGFSLMIVNCDVWIVNLSGDGHLSGVYFCDDLSTVISCPEISAQVTLIDDLSNVNAVCLCDGTSDRLICGLYHEIWTENENENENDCEICL